MLLYGTLNQTDVARAWRATNPVIGTGIAGSVQTTLSETVALFSLFNNGANNPGRRIIPDYLRLMVTAAGTLSTNAVFVVTIDNNSRGMTVAANSSIFNADTDSLGVAGGAPAAASIATVRFGQLAPTAPSANRAIVGHSVVKTQAAPCYTIGDEIMIVFNQMEQGLGPLSGATPLRVVMPVGLTSIGPGGVMLVHQFGAAQTGAPSFEFEAGWWELS